MFSVHEINIQCTIECNNCRQVAKCLKLSGPHRLLFLPKLKCATIQTAGVINSLFPVCRKSWNAIVTCRCWMNLCDHWNEIKADEQCFAGVLFSPPCILLEAIWNLEGLKTWPFKLELSHRKFLASVLASVFLFVTRNLCSVLPIILFLATVNLSRPKLYYFWLLFTLLLLLIFSPAVDKCIIGDLKIGKKQFTWVLMYLVRKY